MGIQKRLKMLESRIINKFDSYTIFFDHLPGDEPIEWEQANEYSEQLEKYEEEVTKIIERDFIKGKNLKMPIIFINEHDVKRILKEVRNE